MFRLKTDQSLINHNKMSIVCTVCSKATTFTALNCPLVCHHCAELLPDATDINYNLKERIVYHQDKDIFN